jgi:hypothetical protein
MMLVQVMTTATMPLARVAAATSELPKLTFGVKAAARSSLAEQGRCLRLQVQMTLALRSMSGMRSWCRCVVARVSSRVDCVGIFRPASTRLPLPNVHFSSPPPHCSAAHALARPIERLRLHPRCSRASRSAGKTSAAENSRSSSYVVISCKFLTPAHVSQCVLFGEAAAISTPVSLTGACCRGAKLV